MTDRDAIERATGRRRADATVTYEVRDLLAEIKDEQRTGFEEIKTALKTKADQRDVDLLTRRLDTHDSDFEAMGGRVGAVEKWIKREDDRRDDQATRIRHLDGHLLPWIVAAITGLGILAEILHIHL